MHKRYRETPQRKKFRRCPYGTFSYGPYKNIPDIQEFGSINQYHGSDEISGWFLGVKAENSDIFSELIQDAINSIVSYRRFFHPEDPSHISESVKRSEGYLYAVQSLKDKFRRLLGILNEYATPFFSMRYQGHMIWDTTMPANLGYFAAMLHNSNNVSIQGSTVTTFLEMMVGDDLCNMIAFSPTLESWAHITCDGTVANLEAMWSARELKFLPVSIKESLKNEFSCSKDIEVILPNGTKERLIDLDTWHLLNIEADNTLILPDKIAQKCGCKIHDVWEILNRKYTVNTLGILKFYRKYLGDVNSPAIIVPSTKHYSLSKSAAILGIGSENRQFIDVYVDPDARMNIDGIKTALDECIKEKIPVILTVAVLGSTEESAVDPLDKIIELREEYRKKYNFDFNIHADAAWGGYHISIIRNDYDIQWPDIKTPEEKELKKNFISDISSVPLSKYVIEQLKSIRFCDSVTIDPHKCGYIPYPAGSIAYRNKKMINLVTFGAPYIGKLDTEPSVGQFGVEGSKPGAAASAVFLSHSVIRPSINGYGKLLSQTLINTKLFYVYLILMAQKKDPFFIVPLPRLPGEKNGDAVKSEIEFIKHNIYEKKVEDIMDDEKLRKYFNKLGPDQNILNYAFNYYHENGSINTDINKVNMLNQMIYDKLHVKPGTPINQYDLFLTITTFYKKDYGNIFISNLANRLKISHPDKVENISYLRSVIMDPWGIDTEVNNSGLNFFQAVTIPKLRKVVIECVNTLRDLEPTTMKSLYNT